MSSSDTVITVMMNMFEKERILKITAFEEIMKNTTNSVRVITVGVILAALSK